MALRVPSWVSGRMPRRIRSTRPLIRVAALALVATLTSSTDVLQAQPMSISEDSTRRSLLKLNASTLLGIPGVAYERRLTPRTSFNLDVTGSPWRSIRGAPFEFLLIIPEWQLHSRDGRLGWYGGVHLGGAVYRIQKWNYRGSKRYQEGFSTLLGGTFGHKRLLRPNVLLDLFIGGGSQHGRYRGYDSATGEQYAGVGQLDESREWVPYRAGVMFGVKQW